MKNDLRLLPRSARFIAYAIFVLCILILVLAGTGTLGDSKDLYKMVTQQGLLIGLLLLALTRQKVEDERTIRMRLISLASAFFFGATLVIIDPYINMMFGDQFAITIQPVQLILTMLFFYFFMFLIANHAS